MNTVTSLRSRHCQGPEGAILFSPGHPLPHLQHHSYFWYLRIVLPIFELSIYKWNHTACPLFFLVAFAQLYVCEIYPYCGGAAICFLLLCSIIYKISPTLSPPVDGHLGFGMGVSNVAFGVHTYTFLWMQYLGVDCLVTGYM